MFSDICNNGPPFSAPFAYAVRLHYSLLPQKKIPICKKQASLYFAGKSLLLLPAEAGRSSFFLQGNAPCLYSTPECALSGWDRPLHKRMKKNKEREALLTRQKLSKLTKIPRNRKIPRDFYGAANQS
ncbi:MAG: hypothetical protein HFG27_11110 [Provencibacterium sp.]|nr:hypothetical protein [Provencibacterium sp.]